MSTKNLKINAKSIRTELKSYEKKPYDCLYEYVWNSFDAGATEVRLDFSIPYEGIGVVSDVVLSDNGSGWDFEDDAKTNNFMSSTKIRNEHLTLPRGEYGRGRYAFIWIAEKIEVYSKYKKLTLLKNTEMQIEDEDQFTAGTKVYFRNITDDFSDALCAHELEKKIAIEFGWFLEQNGQYKLFVNDQEIHSESIIKEIKEYRKRDLPEEIQQDIPDDFNAKIIFWKEKPQEFSKFYYIDQKGKEVFKLNTGLNKKGDEFWHSVYIISSACGEAMHPVTQEAKGDTQGQLDFENNDYITKQLEKFLKTELVNIRKPYLQQKSDMMYRNLLNQDAIPDLTEFGIYDNDSFGELLKTIYTITPSLFTGKSVAERKFVCATFAGLLSTQDKNLIRTVIEKIQELTDEEKQDLLDILNRTKLSNVVATIREIDHRLDVIDKLEVLFADHPKETLEVKHLQKILDENFWIFGEQFRLFRSTEGALRNTLTDYAKDILGIEDFELVDNPSGELDLFLTKTEASNEVCQRNIIVELKRASKVLGKKEYDQIEGYMEQIQTQSLCNGNNQYWEFYLIGKDYNQHIEGKIETAKSYGESKRGLCHNCNDGRFKIYVRKWSDILEVEWKSKMKYLKDKLEIESKQVQTTPDEITKSLLNK